MVDFVNPTRVSPYDPSLSFCFFLFNLFPPMLISYKNSFWWSLEVKMKYQIRIHCQCLVYPLTDTHTHTHTHRFCALVDFYIMCISLPSVHLVCLFSLFPSLSYKSDLVWLSKSLQPKWNFLVIVLINCIFTYVYNEYFWLLPLHYGTVWTCKP